MPVNPEDMIQLLIKTNAELEERLKEKDQTICDLRTTVEELRNTVADLRNTIANLNETLDELKRKFFGTSSEKVKNEQSGDPSEQDTDPEEETVVVKEHTRTRKKKSVRDDLYALLPIRDIKCDVPESERFCPDCDAPMEHLGYKTVREELRITPAIVERVRYLQETLVCPVCREEDDTTIKAAKTPTALLPHSPASPDMVAMVMYQKSCLYLPFYRQEKDWFQKGVPLPRETAAHWYNYCALEYLTPVYEALHQEL